MRERGEALMPQGDDAALEKFAEAGLPEQTRNFDRPEGVLSNRHGVWMLGGVLFGVVLAAGLACFFPWSCKENAHLLCTAAAKNPPWIFLTGLVAGPPVLLTWYWRTKQRIWELALQHAERRQKDTDLLRAQMAEKKARAEADRATYTRAIENLFNSDWIEAAELIEQAGWAANRLPELRKRFFLRVSAFVRAASSRRPLRGPDERLFIGAMRTALESLSFLLHLDETLKADLEGANFVGVTFGSLNLRGTNLTNADLSRADLRGTLFARATLTGVGAKGAFYDETTELDDVQMMMLQRGGALGAGQHGDGGQEAG
jgi:hypothetical protein